MGLIILKWLAVLRSEGNSKGQLLLFGFYNIDNLIRGTLSFEFVFVKVFVIFFCSFFILFLDTLSRFGFVLSQESVTLGRG